MSEPSPPAQEDEPPAALEEPIGGGVKPDVDVGVGVYPAE
jgi:hypothetical protein